MSCTCINQCGDLCTCCVPDGVTNLPQCEPLEGPCAGTEIDINCIVYDGPSYECLGIQTGDNLLDVLMIIFHRLNPLC